MENFSLKKTFVHFFNIFEHLQKMVVFWKDYAFLLIYAKKIDISLFLKESMQPNKLNSTTE